MDEVLELLEPSRYSIAEQTGDTLVIDGPTGLITAAPGQWVMPAHKALIIDDAELRQGFMEAP